MTPTIPCEVVRVHDADTLTCRGGTRIRLAGVSALEPDGSCNSKPDCPTMPPRLATPIARRLAVGRTLQFRIYGRSGKRLVGDNPALRCALLASRAVVPWRYYWRRYKLGECR